LIHDFKNVVGTVKRTTLFDAEWIISRANQLENTSGPTCALRRAVTRENNASVSIPLVSTAELLRFSSHVLSVRSPLAPASAAIFNCILPPFKIADHSLTENTPLPGIPLV
jgi:hypothetical protein